MSPKKIPCKGTDPRNFKHFSLSCLNCSANEKSLGNMKRHIKYECPSKSKKNVSIYCGCCGEVYTDFSLLAIHINHHDIHNKASNVPMFAHNPPQHLRPGQTSNASQTTSSLPPLSPSSLQAIYDSTSITFSPDDSLFPTYTSEEAIVMEPTTASTVILQSPTAEYRPLPSCIPSSPFLASSSSYASASTAATVTAPCNPVLTPYMAYQSQETAFAQYLISEISRYQVASTNLAMHCVWLSGIIERSPDFNIQETMQELSLNPPQRSPDAADLTLRRMLAALPTWPAEGPDVETASIHTLIRFLTPVYTRWINNPPR